MALIDDSNAELYGAVYSMFKVNGVEFRKCVCPRLIRGGKLEGSNRGRKISNFLN